jgi:hypothetical protein
MAQFLGAKELQSFVLYPLRTYDYVYDTEDDLFLFYLTQYFFSHSKLLIKLNYNWMIKNNKQGVKIPK